MAASESPATGEPGPRLVLCPYCGELSRDAERCDACRGNFDPLSRQATQNSMGPWFIRDGASPHRPGCSFEVIRGLAKRGKIGPNTVVRGPTTNQFWSPARRAPGVANLLGICHNCGGPAGPDDVACLNCGATFRYHGDRQHLGLTEVRLLPGQAAPEVIAAGFAPPPGTPPMSAARPIAPRTSVPANPVTPPASGPAAAEPGTRAVPLWVLVLAAIAVMGAITSAAWIMGRLPGFPSPTLEQQSAAPELGAGPNERRPADASDAPSGGASVAGQASATVVSGEDDRSDEVTETQAKTPAVPSDMSAGTADLIGLLAEGSEASLRSAAALAGELKVGGGGAAAERLLAQIPLRRLP